jgi:hypothetical protein
MQMNCALRAVATAMIAVLVVGEPAVAQPEKGQKTNAAEIAFWNTVKDSKNAD